MKILKITAKCSDMFSANLTDNGKDLGAYDGYVPKWFPNPNAQHFGDYVELSIDIDTGKILNWKKPNQSDLKEFTHE